MPMSNLQHIEAELGLEMCGRRVHIGHRIAVLLCEVGIDDRHCQIGALGMADGVRFVVSQHPECECVLLHRTGLLQRALVEITGAHIVQKIGEQTASEQETTQVGKVRSAAGIGSGVFQVLVGRVRIPLAQERQQRSVPRLINDRLMRQY